MSRFNDTFFPDEEELDSIKAIAKEYLKNAVKNHRCIACAHYSHDEHVPGFVTYMGDCSLNHTTWFGDNPNGMCKDWSEKENVYGD